MRQKITDMTVKLTGARSMPCSNSVQKKNIMISEIVLELISKGDDKNESPKQTQNRVMKTLPSLYANVLYSNENEHIRKKNVNSHSDSDSTLESLYARSSRLIPPYQPYPFACDIARSACNMAVEIIENMRDITADAAMVERIMFFLVFPNISK